MNLYVIDLILFMLFIFKIDCNDRAKRYLIFTPSTQWGVFATITIPLHPDTTTSVAWFFEANYYNVANASYLDPLLGDYVGRENRQTRDMKKEDDLTRKNMYHFIESMLERQGYPGHECLLRTICESSSRHYLHNGLVGDLLHLILTPSTSLMEENLDDSYYEAEHLGLVGDCDTFYQYCPDSPIEFISHLVEEL